MDAEQIAAMIADRKAGTPGPWKVFYTQDGGNVIGIGDAEAGGVTDPQFGLWRSGKERESNARRIARVPDMESTIIAQAAELERLREALTEITACLDGSPDYHTQGMGCGLEDRGITDRYDAMQYGWDEALDRVYSEHVSGALDVAYAAMKGDAS